MRGGRRIYRPPIPPRWPLLAQDKWCACVLSTRLGSTSELVIDNFNVLLQVVSLGIFSILDISYYIYIYILFIIFILYLSYYIYISYMYFS